MGWWRRLLRGEKRDARPVRMILFTRTGCHLCDKAEEMLRTVSAEVSVEMETIDIDADPQLIVQYGDKVPVVRIAGKDRFFGCINPVLLRRTLRAEMRHLRELREDVARPSRP